jgi:large subunit ribosomal protein L30
MKKIKVTQIKSSIDRPNRQKLTLQALGLNRMNASKEVEASPQILGMIRAVNHLIKTEEVNGSDNHEPALTYAEEVPVAQQQSISEADPTSSFAPDIQEEESVIVAQSYDTPDSDGEKADL